MNIQFRPADFYCCFSAVRNYVQAVDVSALTHYFGDLFDRVPSWIEYKYFGFWFDSPDQLLIVFYSGVNNH